MLGLDYLIRLVRDTENGIGRHITEAHSLYSSPGLPSKCCVMESHLLANRHGHRHHPGQTLRHVSVATSGKSDAIGDYQLAGCAKQQALSVLAMTRYPSDKYPEGVHAKDSAMHQVNTS
ncbi:unnamed protein product [Clonostachys rosea f. rosea IK726]|uniref:Uncharacterized protein n=1 Tax=Clonostachys rosea f. rosea IK726 TaxID=1349383 RepID=A0ACA9U1I6_BIOOC|nr:unnamed protein product [Clonostachys rosea f. rosea IK726]